MDPVEQLYHLQLESRKQAQQLQRDTTQGFDYLRKSVESNVRRTQQSLGAAPSPQSARSAERGWGSSTRHIGGPAQPHELKTPGEAVPTGLPPALRNILIRNQQMEMRWQREFAERLRKAGAERPERAPSRAADPRHEAEQQRIEARRREMAAAQEAEQRERLQRIAAARIAPPQNGRTKGRGWGDSTRRIGSYGDD